MKLRLSFPRLILAGCLVVVLCTLILVAVILEHSLREEMVGQIRQSLLKETLILKEVISDRWDPDLSLPQTDSLAQELSRDVEARITLIAPDGRVLGDSEVPQAEVPRMDNHAGRPEVRAALKRGRGWSIRRSATLGLDLLYVAALLGERQDPRLVLRVALPLAEVEAAVGRLRRLVLEASLLGVLLSLGVASVVARRLSRPVRDLTAIAAQIGAGELTPRLRRYPNHEIGDLGRAFDQMADRLESEIEAVTQARDRLAAILRAMAEGILVTDEEGRIVLTNRALGQMLALKVDPLGHTPSELLRSAELQEALQQVLAGEPHVSVEVRTLGLRPPRSLEIHLVRLAEEGLPAGVVAVFRDVTARKRVEEVRRDFVANVSHELRTPLTAIRGAVETLAGTAAEKPDLARKFAGIIARHAERLQGLLEDLLDLARLESKAEEPRREEIRVAELTEAVLDTLADLAASRGVELRSDPPPEPLTLFGDRDQIERALRNVVDNAVKYTEPSGVVRLGAEKAGEEVHLVVSDTGLGLRPEEVDRIFERFYRVDKDRSRKMGGTGLGLAIVKHILQAHGGRVEVDSFPGRGSTFRLIFPA